MSMLFHKQLNHFESWNDSKGTQYVLQFYIDSGYEVLFRNISLNLSNIIICQLLDSFTTYTHRYIASRLMMMDLCIKPICYLLRSFSTSWNKHVFHYVP
jgi:hypothetical protein